MPSSQYDSMVHAHVVVCGLYGVGHNMLLNHIVCYSFCALFSLLHSHTFCVPVHAMLDTV